MMKPLSRDKIDELKKDYPAGTRIVCDWCEDPLYPIPAGTAGTVIGVDALGTIHAHWDIGITLGLIPEEDRYHKYTEEN